MQKGQLESSQNNYYFFNILKKKQFFFNLQKFNFVTFDEIEKITV